MNFYSLISYEIANSNDDVNLTIQETAKLYTVSKKIDEKTIEGEFQRWKTIR